ncbi:hypothetical protein K9L16_00420 [Candidatus Pacearchaeota archaeon]|nr:hypothetical protein [Candidatus Pacearchaeota archaeon]
MGVLEQIQQMKSQGKSEGEITNELRQQGISPKEITDAFSQSKIKDAVSSSGDTQEDPYQPSQVPQAPQAPQAQQLNQQNTQETSQAMQPSIMENSQQSSPNQYYSPPQPPQVPQQNQQMNYPTETSQQNYYDYGNYDAGQYAGQYSQQSGYGTDSIVEIAEQVFSEKTKTMQKDVREIKELKTLTESKLEHLSDRVKKIENMIDKLQIAVLEKVGSYGTNLGEIKKEMSMIEDSFRKMTGNIADKISKKPDSRKQKKPIKKKSKK